MARRLACPRCGSPKYWVIQKEKRRCSKCRYEWRPSRLPLRLSSRQWREILSWFVRGVSSSLIAHETGLQRQRVLRALTQLRKTILSDVSPDLHNGAEPEEVYLVNNKTSRRRKRLRAENSPDLTIIYYGGKICVQVFSNNAVGDLISGTDATARNAGNGRGRIQKLKGFLGFLKRHLAGKGGIRRERLPLYIAEHAWRYNHRRFSHSQQIQQLMVLLRKSVYSGGVRNDTLQSSQKSNQKVQMESGQWKDHSASQ